MVHKLKLIVLKLLFGLPICDLSGSLDKNQGGILDPNGSLDKDQVQIYDPSGSLDKINPTDEKYAYLIHCSS